jgi:hypothetical protein
MATSVIHSGFKRLIDRNPTLAILVKGAEVMTFRKDSTGAYGGVQIGVPTYTAAGCADGKGVSLATGYGASSSNRFSAFEIIADTGSTDLTGDTYEAAIHGKLNIGTAQTNATLIAGLFSLDVADESDLSGNYFALRGHLDFWDDSDLSGTSHVGAISAYAEHESTTTIASGQWLSGIDVYQVGAPTVSSGGFNPAIHIRTSTGAWQHGIYMDADDVTTAITINDNTTGISFVGHTNCAVDFQSVTPSTNAGGDQATLIRAGTAGSKMLFATNYQQACLFHLKTTGGRFTGLEMNVYTEDEEPTTSRELRGIEVIARSLANDGGGADPMYAICGSVQILASRDAPAAGSKMVGGYFSYSVDTTDNKSAAGMATCLYLETGSSKNMAQGDYAIYAISNNAAAKPLTAFIGLYGGASAIFQLGPEMTPANGQAWDSSAGINPGTTAGGWIKLMCWTGAAFEARYIAMVTGA